jgi:hypothetical protein
MSERNFNYGWGNESKKAREMEATNKGWCKHESGGKRTQEQLWAYWGGAYSLSIEPTREQSNVAKASEVSFKGMSRPLLVARGRAEGWELLEEGGAGNCFYHCVAAQIMGGADHHAYIRSTVAGFLREHESVFGGFVSEEQSENYQLFCDNTATLGVYVEGGVELMAAATVFNIRLVVRGATVADDQIFEPMDVTAVGGTGGDEYGVDDVVTVAHLESESHYMSIRYVETSELPLPLRILKCEVLFGTCNEASRKERAVDRYILALTSFKLASRQLRDATMDLAFNFAP